MPSSSLLNLSLELAYNILLLTLDVSGDLKMQETVEFLITHKIKSVHQSGIWIKNSKKDHQKPYCNGLSQLDIVIDSESQLDLSFFIILRKWEDVHG